MRTFNPDIIFTKGHNPKTVFITEYKGIDGRLDPSFYEPLNLSLIEEIKKMSHKKLHEIVTFSSESWNQKDFFENEFPYIEISEIDIPTGEVLNVSYIPKAEAPSRAKKIVRTGDILVSTTRPSRGSICLINEKFDLHIASTGFEIIRDIDEKYLESYDIWGGYTFFKSFILGSGIFDFAVSTKSIAFFSFFVSASSVLNAAAFARFNFNASSCFSLHTRFGFFGFKMTSSSSLSSSVDLVGNSSKFILYRKRKLFYIIYCI